jgi:hypothetical protein
MKKYLYTLAITAFILAGCSKMEEKKTTAPPTTQKPPMDVQTESGKDDKVEVFKKAADDADAMYEKDKTDANRKNAIDKNLAAGNYMMFDANVPPKEKYRPALKYYRRVLALDPKNKEAEANKSRIEEIYTQMGMPIPQ